MTVSTGRTQRQTARIAVIGSGISGLSAAWLLSKTCDVTLYESAGRLGGHAQTVNVRIDGSDVPIDTGFIVYNEVNYPNLVALFDHLDVPTTASDMSFAASMDGGRFEYSGTGLKGLLGQKKNALRPRFWHMLRDVMKFYRHAPALLARPDTEDLTLGDYLQREAYSSAFIHDHLMPMGAAIWSMTARDMANYPLHAFLRFFVNHGLLLLSGRPQWRTVEGGSREYVRRVAADFSGTVRLNARIASIRRNPASVTVTDTGGHSDTFDEVVIAAHADEALSMLSDADGEERDTLGAFSYTPNRAVLHSDPNLMPKTRAVWSSWNYLSARNGNEPKGNHANGNEALCVTYWMNRLQRLKTSRDLFVTLNPHRAPQAELVHGIYDYTHPLFDGRALAAQGRLWQLQGRNRTWFCGAYFGSGFHEDGLQSGLAVAEALAGNRRPWTVENESGRISIARPAPALREAAE
ncbi:FAD-dependent oxidoreductase [Neorhizobium sp. NCHU2750]|uniref:NAD(P)/FAD-dependent oxidoreductase n=1 Tax=Neorhizobium sp. NCHU2750 TaxID=1825976 RepID=UPI000E7467F4|nr:NADH-ubiquinone oxidoreductase subunit 6 [Neorhizobium sp. NCHU2750]